MPTTASGERFQLQIWREACRHIELSESMLRLTALVRRRLPADLLVVRRIDPVESILETEAVGQHGGVPVPRHARTSLTPAQLEQFQSWCRERQVLRTRRGSHAPLCRLLLPNDLQGDVLAGPLLNDQGVCGVLLMASQIPGALNDAHEAIFTSLLDPFTVALENHRRLRELLSLREALEAEKRALLSRLGRQDILDEIVGAAGTLSPVMARVDQVAVTSVPVLILGETGTGKEVIARAIHMRSSRRNGPVVRVNCGAIPLELIDSELFGHEKGSFTGAMAQRSGWFERADGGTLFLDEIGELPLPAQVRLLRVLQDGSYERVGGGQTRTADVRIVAATHRNLEQLIANGQFREDLWYRISVFPIYLPPLRSRLQDLPDLVAYFARNAGLRFGGAPLSATSEDLVLLEHYPWPGNVRELSAVIERAAILGGGHRLEIASAMGTKLQSMADPKLSMHSVSAGPFPTIDEAMAGHISRALSLTNGRIEGPNGAAQLLGINPNTLRGRMRRLGIRRDPYRGD
ncbi:MAG: sigma-54 dependent transcriptional regulator [Rhodothermales bacterium]|nr:sigma-54 dependent transcriptional regulator [Rhodothermales bacterium]